MTEELKRYSDSKKSLPATFEQTYIQTNPWFYLTFSNLGDYYRDKKDYYRAYKYYQNALSKEVAGLDRRNHLIILSGKTLKKSHHVDTGN
jgi:hypothetical protein